MSGLYDFIDYWGAMQGTYELQKVYQAMGTGNAIKQFTAESGHGMPKVKREALVTWFRTWLCNDSVPIHETQSIKVPDNDLQCTVTGQVNTSFADAVSIPKYNQDLAAKLADERTKFMQQDNSVVRQKVLNLLGMSFPYDKITSEQTGYTQGRVYDLYKYQIFRKGEMPVPCVVVMPETVGINAKVVLYLNENGKDAVLNDEITILNYVNQGDILVAADLRGYGETTDPASLNETKLWNREYRNTMISLHIGKSIVGQRVIDLISLVDFISGDSKLSSHPIKLVAEGSYGPVAIHTTYLEPRIAQTVISRSVKSYQEYLKNPLQRDVYTNVIYGVLKYYDLKDLVEKAGKGRVQFTD